jgi:hypothetical protein
MDKDRTTAVDREGLGLVARTIDSDAEGGDWEQQQLIPGTAAAVSGSDRSSDRRRRAGLVGIAQAREALADAARRAKARSESRAA